MRNIIFLLLFFFPVYVFSQQDNAPVTGVSDKRIEIFGFIFSTVVDFCDLVFELFSLYQIFSYLVEHEMWQMSLSCKSQLKIRFLPESVILYKNRLALFQLIWLIFSAEFINMKDLKWRLVNSKSNIFWSKPCT